MVYSVKIGLLRKMEGYECSAVARPEIEQLIKWAKVSLFVCNIDNVELL